MTVSIDYPAVESGLKLRVVRNKHGATEFIAVIAGRGGFISRLTLNGDTARKLAQQLMAS